MARTKKRGKRNSIKKDLNSFEREINRNANSADRLIRARRKFFWKLARVIGLIVIFYILVKISSN